MPLLNPTSALEDQYSSSDDELENNLKKIDDDLEAELQAAIDACPEVETAEEIMAALDASDADYTPHDPVPVAPVADWLIDVRELARKHGPFSTAQIAQTVHELSALADGPVR